MFDELKPKELQHVLITEYCLVAGIDWHRDKAVFREVTSISLLSPCVFHMRRLVSKMKGGASEFGGRAALSLPLGWLSELRVRADIPQMDALCYSVTFRIVTEDKALQIR